jgi:hypothetical protein
MRARNPIHAVTAAALALGAITCGGRQAPVTRDDVVDACLALEDTIGTRFGECLGWTDQMTADYIASNQEECEFDVRLDTCWKNQANAYNRCEERTASESCDELCPNGYCRVVCPYVCPEP